MNLEEKGVIMLQAISDFLGLFLSKINGPAYVFGIKGISELFNVSRNTAAYYKKTFLQDAIVCEDGYNVKIDANKARELYDQWKTEKKHGKSKKQ